MICVSISDPGQIGPAVESGINLIELRFDLIGMTPATCYSGLPEQIRTVATCRPGPYPDPRRKQILEECISLGARYIDLELDAEEQYAASLVETARRYSCEVICSHHDFKSTPSSGELKDLLRACYLKGGTVAKIATQVSRREDILSLISLYGIPGRKVVLGMGRMGRITRVLAPYLGSEFTFASPAEGHETAPGQISATELMDIFKKIDLS